MVHNLGMTTPIWNTPENGRLRYFKNTAGSVLPQNLEFLWAIVDNGSTDETTDFIRDLNDPRIVLLDFERQAEERRTASAPLNYGFNYLFERGCDYFAYVHSDDLLTPNSLELRVKGLKENDMVYGRVAKFTRGKIYNTNFPLERSDYCSADIMNKGFPHHTSMWSRRMMEQMIKRRGGELFDRKIFYAEDSDVTLYCKKFIENDDFSLGFIDEILYIWVMSKINITQSTRAKEVREQIKYINKKHGIQEETKFQWKEHIKRPFFWLPESIKEPLRPVRDIVNKLSRGILYHYNKPEDISPESLGIDSNWLKS